MNLRTIGTTLTAAAALAVSLSACGSTPQTSSAPQAGGAQGGASVGSNSRDGGRSGGEVPCAVENMNPTFELSSVGHVNAHLKVTNTSNTDCTLNGEFPDVAFMDRNGNPSDGLDIKHGQPGTGNPILLRGGESATADAEWPTGPACNRVWAVNLTVNDSEPKSIEPTGPGTSGGVFDLCGGEATISGWQQD